MRYLTLAARYRESPLRDDFAGLDRDDISLPDDLAERIEGWNRRYQHVIPLDAAERQLAAACEEIAALDAEGLALREEIDRAVTDAKVRYFSEGLLQYVNP